MASGKLPFETYHRAQSLGEGTYGYVFVGMSSVLILNDFV